MTSACIVHIFHSNYGHESYQYLCTLSFTQPLCTSQDTSQATMATKKSLLKQGHLLKRQRGQSANADLKKLRFQQRFIRLDEKTLEYFEDQKARQARVAVPYGTKSPPL